MTVGDAPGEGSAPPPLDVDAVLRSRGFTKLLVLSALIGILVSLASWGFLEVIHGIQQWVYEDLPSALGFASVPQWWPLPTLLLAGILIAVAIARLPGRGGHEPSHGLQAGALTQPIELPGVLLASLASIGLGLVLGPEAPLLALGTGLTLLVLHLTRRDIPDRLSLVLTAAAAFAALSTIFGNPIIGAVIVIEAAGLGGPTLPLVLLPGLTAAGVGSLVFIGIDSLTGLSSSAYAISPLTLPPFTHLRLTDFAWTIALSLAAAIVTTLIVQIGRRTEGLVARRPYVFTPGAALAVAALAILWAETTGQPTDFVLFSGQDAMGHVVSEAATWSLATLTALLLLKGLAWGVSLGSGRGGPTFPAIFLGIVAGLLAGHLPGFSQTPAVAVLIGASCVSILRLPLSSIVIALLVTQAGLATSPLVIVGVVVAYVTVNFISPRSASA